MKRIILLTIIVIFVFSFSSCELADWLLDAIYPTGEKSISVNLDVDYSIDVNMHPIVVALIPVFVTDTTTGAWSIDTTHIAIEKFRNQNHINWEFKSLAKGNGYRVIAFYDIDENGKVNDQEPSISFLRTDMEVFDPNMPVMDQPLFDFMPEDSPDTMTGGAWIDLGSRIDPMLLGMLSGSEGTTYDLQIYIDSFDYNGYCDVYLKDVTNNNVLMYSYTYLDGLGNGYVNFWGVFDPAGLDQKVIVEFYNTLWVSTGQESADILGQTSGLKSITINH